MRLIYLCHQFGGKEENVKAVENIYRKLVKRYPDCCFFSPHHATGFLYHETTRRQGMDYCLAVLDRCDAMLVFGEDSMSEGCMEEKGFCKKENIPIIDLGSIGDAGAALWGYLKLDFILGQWKFN